jgi:CRISPR-associated protein Csc1
MTLYHCALTLHDNVFFATREMGILYETEKYLHNWALSYALFEATYIPRPYRLKGEFAQRPSYLDDPETHEQSLQLLNRVGIYLFPAQPLTWSYQVNTFKAAQVSYYGKSKQFGDKGANRNYPINYGRAKELAVGSRYRAFLTATPEINIPKIQWIRLGKWSAKIRVEFTVIPNHWMQTRSGEYTCQHPLNPLDLASSNRLLLYNRIVMPPVSLVSQAQLTGDYWEIRKPREETIPNELDGLQLNGTCLPRGMFYGASSIANVS